MAEPLLNPMHQTYEKVATLVNGLENAHAVLTQLAR
jgi:hypothetical protein